MRAQICWLAASLLGLSGVAHAAKIALIPIEASGVEAGGRVVDGALRQGVQRTPVLIEAGAVQMSLEEAKTSFSCFEEAPECMVQVGSLLGADQLLWGTLKRAGGQWTLQLKLLDVAGARSIRTTRQEVPNDARAMERLAAIAEAFVRDQPIPTISLVKVDVTSDPEGVLASVDGRGIGATPAQVELEPGQYELALRAPDGRVVRQDLQVKDAPLQVSVDLTPPAPAGEGLSTGTIVGIATGVVAVAGAGLGLWYGLQVQEKADEAADLPNPSPEYDRAEDEFKQAQILSNVGWGVAIAAGATAAYFLIWHDDEGEVAVAPGPTGVSVMGRF